VTDQPQPEEPRRQAAQRMTARTTLVERVLWRLAIGCAALLLFAPMTPRTSWTYLPQSESGPGGGMTHSAGWDWIAPLLGIVALVSLIVGRRRRPDVAGAVFSATIASISFAGAAAAALGHWLDLMSGSLREARWVIYPAPAVGYFAAIAIVGMVAALVLLGSWLHQGDAEPRP
jgi:putative copper export protein